MLELGQMEVKVVGGFGDEVRQKASKQCNGKNKSKEKKRLDYNDVFNLASLKNDPRIERKQVIHRLQSLLEEQQKQRYADSIAELIKKISERNEDNGSECNAVKIRPIVLASSAKEKEPIAKDPTKLHPAEK
ncbi:unnamed protein product [Linum trigynum]|uniref:Uncharacterized protein n=1 Tax=Linum trigynum TaxID=586398 RepID=A0AAV2E8C5_9ROSI